MIVCWLVEGKSTETLQYDYEFMISNSTLFFRNVIYNLSIFDLTEQQRLIWYSPEDDIKMCLVKGKDDVSCLVN